MKALLCTRLGSPHDLEIQDVPDPAARAGEAVVAVKAAALNFFDLLAVAGKYQVKPPLPFSPAAEFAGIIESVGPGVADFTPGDAVIGHIPYGAARERLAVKADHLIKMPGGIGFEQAAGLSITYGTTLYALRRRARLAPGETLAVLGAAGGIGLAAIEIGRILGAQVIACASSDEKLAFARQHGASGVVNYAKEDLKDALRALTGGRGVNVVFDPVGGVYAESALRGMDWDGRFLVIGFAAGDAPQFPMNIVLLKNYEIIGVHWGAWTEQNRAEHRADMTQILSWGAEGLLSAHVHAVYPLTRAVEAFEDISGRKAMGKVILRP